MKKNQLLVNLKKEIRKDFGPKCKDWVWNCACCKAWEAYEILKDLWWEGKYKKE